MWNRRRKQDQRNEAAEIGELLDRHDHRASVAGDGQLMVDLGKVLGNVRELLERIDLDPSEDWAAEDLVSFEEIHAFVVQMGLGQMLISETAWYAREILANRWPLELVEGAIAARARHDMFLEQTFKITTDHELMAKEILNRALASVVRVDEHPGVADLDSDAQVQVWFGLLGWYMIKTGALHQREGTTQ